MHVNRDCVAAMLLATAAILSSGCSEPAAPVESTGAIEVRVSTSGAVVDFDPNGYFIRVDAGLGRTVQANTAVTFVELSPGSHVVRLESLPPNCSFVGTNEQSVVVAAGVKAVASFGVACVANTGTLKVTATTSGLDPDPDGYVVVVGERPRGGLPATGTVDIADVRQGQQEVTLAGVSGNCLVDGAHTRTVSVVFAATTEVAFVIKCARSTSLQVTTATTGEDLDLNGYSINLRQEGASSSTDARMQANGTFTFSGLLPADYVLTVSDVTPNCELAGQSARRITVGTESATSTVIEVACAGSTRLTFVNGTGSKAEIYTINSNGSDIRQLTSNFAADVDPAWSPDGSRIAFTSERDGGSTEIYAMNADGSSQARLTKVAGWNFRPAWSPDGARIAFVSQRDGGNAEIYVMNADGTGQVRLTSNDAYDDNPAWSPDGRRIAFMSTRDGLGSGIWVMNADGSGLTRLTSNARGDWQPAWSPDGTRIAFSCGVSATLATREICIVNADGTGLAQLTQDSEYAVSPTWSPDGRKIAFETVLEYDFYYPGPSQIAVVGIDGVRYSSPIDLSEPSEPSWRSR